MAKRYKHHKRGKERFVQLPEWLQASPAWASMKPGPRALYIELKRRYTAYNNGQIFLSHRDAAKELNVGRDTVSGYYQELEARGFINKTRGHHLGRAGIGMATLWALTEYPLDGTPATKDFMSWRKTKPP